MTFCASTGPTAIKQDARACTYSSHHKQNNMCEASSTVYPKTMCSPGCNDILHLQSEQHLLAI